MEPAVWPEGALVNDPGERGTRGADSLCRVRQGETRGRSSGRPLLYRLDPSATILAPNSSSPAASTHGVPRDPPIERSAPLRRWPYRPDLLACRAGFLPANPPSAPYGHQPQHGALRWVSAAASEAEPARPRPASGVQRRHEPGTSGDPAPTPRSPRRSARAAPLGLLSAARTGHRQRRPKGPRHEKEP